MKTSNKILLVLIAFLLAIPLLLLLAFRSRIKNNQYTTQYGSGTRIIHQPVTAAKYLVVNGKGLECHIVHSDSSYVDYHQTELQNNNIQVTSKGDTLFITTDVPGHTVKEGYIPGVYYTQQYAKVYLPHLEGLTVNYAIVNLDTISRDLQITARGGSCNIARYDLSNTDGYTNYGISHAEIDTCYTTNSKGEKTPCYMHIAKLAIDAEGSSVCIGNIAKIDTLSISAQQGSSLFIKNDAVINQMKLRFDSTTLINGNMSQIKRFMTNL